MNENALVLHDLLKDFAGKRAVDNISFSLRRGEILGLLGPNGAGKTTTIRMVMDIIAPDAGTIEILGEKFSEKMKDRIGYLPEERGLYRKLKVMDTLLFGIESRDPVIFAAVPVFLLGIAMLASYIPARRASRLDPMRALRME